MQNASPEESAAVQASPEAPVETSQSAQNTLAWPFEVKNRSRAERIAKVLFGPNTRSWINRDVRDGVRGVQIGTEKGSAKEVFVDGVNFTEALRLSVKAYLNAAETYEDAKKRISTMSSDCDVREFADGTLSRFPQYLAEKAALAKKQQAREQLRAMAERAAAQASSEQIPVSVGL